MSIAAASGSSRSARTLGVSVSAYYQRAQRAGAPRERSRTSGCSPGSASCTRPTTTPTAIGGCGRRCGVPASRCRAAACKRLMKSNGIVGAKRRGKPWRTTTARPAGRSPPGSRPARLRRRAARTSSGSPTSPICAAGKDSSSSRSCSTPTAGRSSAGSSPATCAPTSSSTHCKMALGQRGPGADVELIHHSDRGIAVHEHRLHPDARPTTTCSPRSDRSATPTTTRSPSRSSTASRPS